MELKIFICLTLCGLVIVRAILPTPPQGGPQPYIIDDDSPFTTTLEFIISNNYTAQHKLIETKDGYLLSVHRIFPQEGTTPKANPVLLVHGLLQSSAQWVMYGQDKSLGFLLADEGYDVFLADSRGNRYSNKHVSLSPNSPEYWDFTWHEMGLYDAPAIIDYVLEKTGSDQLYYIGHSQGTTQYFVMDSLLEGYAAKVKTMFAFAPVAFMAHATSQPLVSLAQLQQPVSTVSQLLGANAFLPGEGAINYFGGALCKEQYPLIAEICEDTFFLIIGFDEEQFDREMLPEIRRQVPAGASTKILLHYAQSINKGTFRPFDYGILSNLKLYGSIEPPDYPIQNAKSKYVFFTASNDLLSNETDVKKLSNILPNVVNTHHVKFEKFNHNDYLWAIDVKTLVYDILISELNKE